MDLPKTGRQFIAARDLNMVYQASAEEDSHLL